MVTHWMCIITLFRDSNNDYAYLSTLSTNLHCVLECTLKKHGSLQCLSFVHLASVVISVQLNPACQIEQLGVIRKCIVRCSSLVFSRSVLDCTEPSWTGFSSTSPEIRNWELCTTIVIDRSFFDHLGATAVNGVLTIHQRYSVGVVNEPQVLNTAASSYLPI